MKLLLKSLIITLIGFTFVGCKSSSSGNKVTTHRSKKADQKGTTDTKNKSDQKGAGTGAESGKSTPEKDSTISDRPSVDTNKIKTETCDSSTPSGWESHVIKKTKSNQNVEDGIQVHYLMPRNSSLRNPVLVLTNQLEPVSQELAEKILKAGNENDFDPILMEPRGTGCSTALPKDKSRWNQFTAEMAAEDAESIRSTMKDKKWKVWSFQNSALIALKMVELNPSSITSLHIADFTIARTPLDQEKNKLKAQIDAWVKFKEFSKTKGFEITADVMSKIDDQLKLSKCPDNQLVCKLDLKTSLIDYISSNDDQWKEAVEIVKLLSEGKISEELNKIAQKNQKNYLYSQLLVAAHLDSDAYLTACEKAMNDTKLKDQAALTPIASCVIDRALKNSYLSELREKVQHKKMNYGLIQKNMKAEKIALHLAVAERSLLNPMTSVNDTAKMITGVSDLETLYTPETQFDFEISFNEKLLGSLK